LSAAAADQRHEAAGNVRRAFYELSACVSEIAIYGKAVDRSAERTFESAIVTLRLIALRLSDAVELLEPPERRSFRVARRRVYNINEIALALECSTKTVRRMHAQGKLNTFQLNGKRGAIQIRGADLIRYMNERGL
jgi:DNA-directed RNA polymerase specialized sigma24 family protein